MPESALSFRSSKSLEAAWWTRTGVRLYRPISYSMTANSTIEAQWLPLADCVGVLKSNWQLRMSGTGLISDSARSVVDHCRVRNTLFRGVPLAPILASQPSCRRQRIKFRCISFLPWHCCISDYRICDTMFDGPCPSSEKLTSRQPALLSRR